MRVPAQKHYSSLGAFGQYFLTGVPILTYHKIGLRPKGVRLKGLYLSSRRFARQLAELRQAGFATPRLHEVIGVADNQSRQVVITFDDGYRNVLDNALTPLAQNGFRAVQYLVANCLGKRNEWDLGQGEALEPLMDLTQVRDWLAAGHEIGSHTLNHPHLTQLPLAEAREEVFSSKKRLEDRLGTLIEHFCYPYGEWNLQIRDWVIEAGYRTACTTEFGVNTSASPPFALKRITARYPTRNWRTLVDYLRDLWP